ncbi:MAG: hypothetical protein J3T61_09020 [Candidatus Brocadiales bacterium]|nr:hypothetical protein [Candidatus Bathyanammoxibius sp.]
MPLTTPQLFSIGKAETVVNTAVTTGVALAQQFVLPTGSGQYGSLITIHAVLTAITVLTADLEASLDGGVTFDTVLTMDFFVLPVQVVQVGGGPAIYRINVKSITGTSVVFKASIA